MRKLLILLTLLLLLPLTASADVLGVEVGPEDARVDLTGVKDMAKNVNTLIRDLEANPQVTEVDLMNVKLDVKYMGQLVKACPNVHFHWKVKVADGYFTCEDQVMDLDALHDTAKLSQIAAALDALPNIQEVLMYKYRPSLNGMRDYLLSKYPDVRFGWTLDWLICNGRRVRLRSDATAFSTAKGRQDPRYTAQQIWDRLQFFPELLAIDVGHNNVTDLSFLTNFPGLKRLICIDSKVPVTDLTPLTELYELEYIELFMQDITDISPLANHEKLLDLNLCHNNITDLSPLYSCTSLERLWISYNPNLKQEEIDKLQAALPNCHIEAETYQSTGAGWREHERYDIMYYSFQDNTYYPFGEPLPEK